MRPGALANAAVLAALAVYLGWTVASGGSYAMRVLSVAGIYALLAMGYQFIFGHAGALALSQAAFMGIGAYASGLLALRAGLPFDAALPLSVGAPVLLALLVAVPVLRLQTHYFALATLLLSQIAFLAATEWHSLTGGANGLGGVPGVVLLGQSIRPGWPLLAAVWGFVAGGALLAWVIARGRLGPAWAAMRAHPAAAASLGIDGPRLRLIAFLLSAGYAGLAGSLYVHTLRVVSPDALAFPVVVTCLTIVVVGSRTNPVGAIAAAVLVVQLPEWFRGLQDFYLLAYGIALLVFVAAVPGGLMGVLESLARRVLPPRAAPQPCPAPLPARPRSADGLLEITGLSRRFGGVQALDGVSLAVRPGEALGLIGPNGSGKTTLVNVVTGIYPPDAGRVRLGGQDITGWPAHRIARAGIARTFQAPALVEDMTALDNVAVARSSGRDLARAEAAGLLDRMGALDAAGLQCGALPPGLRRRVEIARALALQPRLLLLDEPAAGLTASEQADLARRLRGLVADGVGLLVIEHDMAFLAPLADRMACLDRGRLIAEGAPAAVQADPAVIEAYLGRTHAAG